MLYKTLEINLYNLVPYYLVASSTIHIKDIYSSKKILYLYFTNYFFASLE